MFTLRVAEARSSTPTTDFDPSHELDHIGLPRRNLRRRRPAPASRPHVARRTPERRRPRRRGARDCGRRPRRRPARPAGLGLPDVRDLARPHAPSGPGGCRKRSRCSKDVSALEDGTHAAGVLDAAGIVALGRLAIHTATHARLVASPRSRRSCWSTAHPLCGVTQAGCSQLFAVAEGDAEAARGWLRAPTEPDGERSCRDSRSTSPTRCCSRGSRSLQHDDELAQLALLNSRRRSELNPGIASIAATAAHARGLLEPSLAELREAVDLFERAPRGLELASALEDLGVELIATDREAAIDALGRTLAVYTELGATWDARRVRSRLRELGVRRRLVAAEPETDGWAALTTSELTVARTRRRRADESRSRRTPLRLAAHRQQPSPPCVLETRHHLARRVGTSCARLRDRLIVRCRGLRRHGSLDRHAVDGFAGHYLLPGHRRGASEYAATKADSDITVLLLAPWPEPSGLFVGIWERVSASAGGRHRPAGFGTPTVARS